MYEDPAGLPEFGDVYSADWLFDAYLRGDAIALKPVQMRGGSPAFAPAKSTPERDLVLAHGQSCMAIMMSDDCEAESMVLRRGRAKSRLLFAGLAAWPNTPSEAKKAKRASSFRRHALEPATGFAGGVVDFQLLFAVAVEALESSEEPRLVRLSPGARADLEIRWCAYATRRGPRTHLDNAEKFARLITADGDTSVLRAIDKGTRQVDPGVRDACLAVAKALSQAWKLEGEGLGAVSEAHERADKPDASIGQVVDQLTEVAALSTHAAAALSALVGGQS